MQINRNRNSYIPCSCGTQQAINEFKQQQGAAVNSVITNRHDGINHTGPQMELTQIGLNFRTNLKNSIHPFTLVVRIFGYSCHK